MDRVIPARIAEKTFRQIGNLSGRLRTGKKAVIGRAVGLSQRKIEVKGKTDVFDQTLGAWKRRETPGRTVAGAREAFRRSMERHARWGLLWIPTS